MLAIQEETRWHGWIPGGQIVEVNNIYGNVRAEPASGDEIEVVATKRGLSDPSQVTIEVVGTERRIVPCARSIPTRIRRTRSIAAPATAAAFVLRPHPIRRRTSAGEAAAEAT